MLLVLAAGCDAETVSFPLQLTKTVAYKPDVAMLRTLGEEKLVASTRQSEWPEGTEFVYTEDDPFVVTIRETVNIAEAELGVEQFEEYQSNIREIKIDELSVRIVENTLKTSHGPIHVVVANLDTVGQEMWRAGMIGDGTPDGELQPSGDFVLLEVNDSIAGRMNRLLLFEDFQVGVQGPWIGTMTKDYPVDWGSGVTCDISFAGRIIANKL